MTYRRRTNGICSNRLQLLGKLVRGANAFRNDNDIRVLTVRPRTIYFHYYIVKVENHLGDDYYFRAARNTRKQGYIAATPAHNLDNRNPLVRSHRVAKLVDNVNTGVYSSIEAERIVGIFKVVVNRARDTDCRYAVALGQTFRAPERAVAADNHKPVDTSRFESFNRLFLTRLRKHFKTPCRTKLCAASLDDIRNGTHFHRNHIVVDKALISALDSVNFHTVINGGSYYRPYASVHSGSVPTAGKQAYSFHNNLRLIAQSMLRP